MVDQVEVEELLEAPGGGLNGGTGNTPPVSHLLKEIHGGKGQSMMVPQHTGDGGGGGGAGAAGSDSFSMEEVLNSDHQVVLQVGAGGAGTGTAINPSPSVGTTGPSGPLRYFAGGGGGGTNNTNTPTGGVWWRRWWWSRYY